MNIVERCLWNHYFKCGGELTPRAKKGNFVHPLAVKLKLVALLLHNGDSPLPDTYSGAIPFSITSITYYFRIQTTIPL